MQTLKTDCARANKITELALRAGSLQAAGGDRRPASPVRPDFRVLPLLSESPAKWRGGGPATL